jgi:quercetin dioxygenase-like cupin family protein
MSLEPTEQVRYVRSEVEERDYEGLFNRWAEFYQRAHHGKTLVRGAEVPYHVSRQGASRFYVMPHFEELAISQWVVFVRYLKDHPNGRHRHQGGIALYALDGQGYSMVNGERYDWGAGDIVYLPLMPGGLDHQHFPAVPGEPATFMGIIYEPLIVGVGAEMTQLEPEEHGVGEASGAVAAGSKVSVSDIEPTLAGLVALRDYQRRAIAIPPLIRGEELAVDETGFGRLRWYLHPGRAGFAGTSPTLVFSTELAAGQSTDGLKIPGNGFMYVLEGEAEITVGREQHHCVPTDMVCLPARRSGITTSIDAGEEGAKVLVALANLSGLGGIALGADFALQPRS